MPCLRSPPPFQLGHTKQRRAAAGGKRWGGSLKLERSLKVIATPRI